MLPANASKRRAEKHGKSCYIFAKTLPVLMNNEKISYVMYRVTNYYT